MSHCEAIRIIIDARRYIAARYGATEAHHILSLALRRFVPTEYVCGQCGGRHSSTCS